MSSTSNSGDLRVRVRHREFISDIVGSTVYAVSTVSINPGLQSSFPWLSGLAALFESYKFNNLCFQFRTSSGTNAIGKVLLSVDWDAADAAPLSKTLQLQERTKADDAAWSDFELICDKQDLDKFGIQRYIRSSVLTANLDIKTYDVGNLRIGRQGQADSTTIVGELYVCYDVDLITPNPSSIVPAISEQIDSSSNISNVNLFGDAAIITASPAVVTSSALVNTLTFSIPGNYLLNIKITGTSPVITVFGGTATTVGLQGSVSSATGHSVSRKVTIASVGQTIIFTVTGVATDCRMLISDWLL